MVKLEFCRLQRMTKLVMEGRVACKGEAVAHVHSALNETICQRFVIVMNQGNS